MDPSSNIPIDSLGDILESAPTFSANGGPAPNLASEDRYLCRIDGKEAGPFGIPQLQGLIEEGQLHRTDRVRHCDSKCWLPCQEIPGLLFPAVDASDEEQIEAASSLLNELFSEPESFEPTSDLLSLDDLPDADDSTSPGVIDASDRTPTSSASKRKSPKPAVPSPSAPKLPTANLETPEPSLEPDATVASLDDPKSPSIEPRDTQVRLPVAPTQIASPLKYHPPAPVPSAPKAPEKPKRKRRSESGRQYSLPSKPLVLGALGLILVLAVVRFWPASSSGIQGVVAIDGTPLKVGSVSLSSPGAVKQAMSFSVIDGRFHSAETLPDGEYDAIIVVGSPLGITVSQLENTPFQTLNGARYKLKVTLPSATPELKFDLAASEAIPLKTPGGADAVSSK